MQKITPFLWFNGDAGEAMDFYISVFKDSKIIQVSKYGETGPGPAGTVMTGTFQIEGQEFMVLNGGPMFSFSSAISFFVNCEKQEEIDHYWDKLGADGEEMQCGWLKDKFGVTWQIVPAVLGSLLGHKDPAKANAAMQAMMKMTKLDIAVLKAAVE